MSSDPFACPFIRRGRVCGQQTTHRAFSNHLVFAHRASARQIARAWDKVRALQDFEIRQVVAQYEAKRGFIESSAPKEREE